MKEITEAIDAYLKANFDCPGFKFFGLSELMTKGTQVYPVTVNGREQVAINDRFDGIMYHRFLSSVFVDAPDFSFGSQIEMENTTRLRTVIAFKVSKFAEEFIFDFQNAIPQELTMTGYEFVYTENGSIIVDQAAIYLTEFGGGDYEKHIVTWNIYALEYDVQFIKC